MGKIILWYSDPYAGQDSDRPEIELNTDLETAFLAWRHLTAISWKHLLVDGGILDQPEALWEDVIKLEALNRWYRKSRDMD